MLNLILRYRPELAGYKVDISTTSYTVTTNPLSLAYLKVYTIDINVENYDVSTSDIVLNYVIPAGININTGIYLVSTNPIVLNYIKLYTLDIETATIVCTRNAVGLLYNRVAVLTPSSFTISSLPIVFNLSRNLPVSTKSLIVTGFDINLSKVTVYNINSANYFISYNDISFQYIDSVFDREYGAKPIKVLVSKDDTKVLSSLEIIKIVSESSEPKVLTLN